MTTTASEFDPGYQVFIIVNRYGDSTLYYCKGNQWSSDRSKAVTMTKKYADSRRVQLGNETGKFYAETGNLTVEPLK